jgi:4-aminobutyrate aminotransferase
MQKLPLRMVPGEKSQQYLTLSRTYEPAASLDQVPVVWDHAERVWIIDVDGNKYLDFTSGVLVTNLGHSHPALIKAVQEQAERLMNCYSFPTPERVTLAQRLVETLPSNLDRVFLLSTGAEATEAAIRIAKRHTHKYEILAFYGAFHGRTYGAMSVAGSASTRREFGPSVPGGIMAPYAYCYRCFYGKSFPECQYHCINSLDSVVSSTSTGELGAIIVEPYQGTAGFVFPPDGWLKKLEEWATERDLVLIVDEVQASFGRTGRLYAIEWEDIHPQMLCLGKGFGSGVPSSAVAAESKVLEEMAPGELSSTWGGNPLACAASLAVLKVMKEEKLPENAEKVGGILKQSLLDLQKRLPCLGDVRGKGLVIGLEIVNPEDRYTPAPQLTKLIIRKASERGLMLGKVGLYGNVIRVAPPLVITEEEALLGVEILEDAIISALD